MTDIRTVTIGSRRVGPGEPVFLIAEMAWAHDGTLANALTIARGAVEAGVDALNVHLTSMPSYMVRYYGSGPGQVSAGKDVEPVYDYLVRISLSESDLIEVARVSHAGGIKISAMANDIPSLGLADQMAADIYAVPPACLVERPYLEALGERGKVVLLGIGGATLAEIEQAINILASKGTNDVLLQYGIQNYPTDPRLVNMRYLVSLQNAFGLPVFYHDHTEGGTKLATEIPMLSIPLGICGIEKHMTHNRAAKGEDFESALDPADLKLFVENVRIAEAALGRSSWRSLTENEIRYRGVVRKRAVAREALAAGATLDFSTVVFKRCDEGLYPDEFERVIGRKTRIAIAADDAITADSVA